MPPKTRRKIPPIVEEPPEQVRVCFVLLPHSHFYRDCAQGMHNLCSVVLASLRDMDNCYCSTDCISQALGVGESQRLIRGASSSSEGRKEKEVADAIASAAVAFEQEQKQEQERKEEQESAKRKQLIHDNLMAARARKQHLVWGRHGCGHASTCEHVNTSQM